MQQYSIISDGNEYVVRGRGKTSVLRLPAEGAAKNCQRCPAELLRAPAPSTEVEETSNRP